MLRRKKTGLVEINKNSEHVELPPLYGQIVHCALLPCVQFDYAQYQHKEVHCKHLQKQSSGKLVMN